MKTLFAQLQQEKGLGDAWGKNKMDASYVQLLQRDVEEEKSFLETLEAVLLSDDESIRQRLTVWVIEKMALRQFSERMNDACFTLLRPLKDDFLATPLCQWLPSAEYASQEMILGWLGDIVYTRADQRQRVIAELLNRYVHNKHFESAMLDTLKRLDAYDGEVTEMVLQRFPTHNSEHNHRLILLLGQTGRYRVVKPMIAFSQEYPAYRRSVVKALNTFAYDEVDLFYLDCLQLKFASTPLVMIEAVKQVRKRRLRKAIPLLDELFPLDDSSTPLIGRAINGEIALTMASFGAYAWGREKLLPEMMLNGVNAKYLRAVDILGLEDAVPYLKAIILMPETPEILAIQHQAYQICERLLLSRRTHNL